MNHCIQKIINFGPFKHTHHPMQINLIDISEDEIFERMPEVLNTLLRDHTLSGTEPDTFRHIKWGTRDYEALGKGFQENDPIEIQSITGKYGKVIQPHICKTKEVKRTRIKAKAEVFTPSWICNAQNNLVDRAWFDGKDMFNTENPDHTWTVTQSPIPFTKPNHRWRDYVNAPRMEVACGEAPYITSRYDTTTGEFIPTLQRIGFLDRKLRVVTENCRTTKEWIYYAKAALHSCYGFEWQGDNLLLAREAVLYTTIEWFLSAFDRMPMKQTINHWAYIISWNLWQMDGTTLCVPGTQTYCLIRDWKRWANRYHKDRKEDYGYRCETFYEQVYHKKPQVDPQTEIDW